MVPVLWQKWPVSRISEFTLRQIWSSKYYNIGSVQDCLECEGNKVGSIFQKILQISLPQVNIVTRHNVYNLTLVDSSVEHYTAPVQRNPYSLSYSQLNQVLMILYLTCKSWPITAYTTQVAISGTKIKKLIVSYWLNMWEMILRGKFFDNMWKSWRKKKFKFFIKIVMELEWNITYTCHQTKYRNIKPKIAIWCQNVTGCPNCYKDLHMGGFQLAESKIAIRFAFLALTVHWLHSLYWETCCPLKQCGFQNISIHYNNINNHFYESGFYIKCTWCHLRAQHWGNQTPTLTKSYTLLQT